MNWSYKLSGSDVWSDIFVLDLETEPIKDENRRETTLPGRWVFGVIYDGVSFYRFSWDQETALRSKVQELADQGKIGVAHNMEFDLTRIYGNLVEASSTYIHRHRFLSVSIPPSGSHKKKHRTVKWVDSMNLFPLSLREVGTILGYPKGDSNYRFYRGMEVSEQDWHYCETDTKIVYDAVGMFRGLFRETFGVEPNLTLASSAFKVIIPTLSEALNGRLTKDRGLRYEMTLSDSLHEYAERSYKGGMVRALDRGTFDGLNYYDINSSYPFQMTKPFPDPRYGSEIVQPSNNVLFDLLDRFEGFADLEIDQVNVKKPYLPYRHTDGLLYYLREGFRTTVSFPELRYLMEHPGDYQFEVSAVCYSPRLESPFRSFVEKQYKVKRENKKSNPGLSYQAKILLNSSYGKFQQKNFDEQYIPDADEHIGEKRRKLDDVEFDLYLEFFNKYWSALDDVSGYIITDKQNADHDIFAFGAYITGRGRVQLWPYVQDAVYCDTDSIFTSAYLPTGDDLGAWKLEGRIDDVQVAGKKWYSYLMDGKKTVKIKGVSVDDTEIDLFHPPPFYRMVHSKEALRRDMDAGQFILQFKELEQIDDTILPGGV